MAKPKAIKAGPAPKQRDVFMNDGPWQGLKVSTRIAMGCYTLVMRVSGQTGRYRMGECNGTWEPINV